MVIALPAGCLAASRLIVPCSSVIRGPCRVRAICRLVRGSGSNLLLSGSKIWALLPAWVLTRWPDLSSVTPETARDAPSFWTVTKP